MVAIFSSGNGINFTEPKRLRPTCATAGDLLIRDSASGDQGSSATAFFTEMARRGLQDTTNWTADTYKTILSVTGAGEVAAYIGCTAGGAETHTVEFTVDGVVSTVTIAGLASGERGCLWTKAEIGPVYTTTILWANPYAEALDADKATWGGMATNPYMPPWRSMQGIPCLQFNQSLLIRAKHSASITNSTATAYSAVMYRLFLAS